MANKTSRVYVTQLTGGLDTSIANSLIDEKAASDLLNVRWTNGGIVTKRDGFKNWGAELTAPKWFGKLQGTSPKILAMDGTTLKETSTGVWTNTTISGGITFNASAEAYSATQVKKDKIVIWNRLDPGTAYTTAGASRNGMMPSGGFSEMYKGYHWAAGVTAQGPRVYISTLADPTDFTNDPAATTDGEDPDNATTVPGATVFTGSLPDVAQFVDISPEDGEPVTGLFKHQDFLIIAKTNSLWSCTMDSATNKPVIQLITRAAGCVAFGSGANVKNDLYLLSGQGVITLGNEKNYTSTTLRHNLLSEKIYELLLNINEAAVSRAAAVFWDHMYIISIPTGASTVNNVTFMLDTRFGGWSVWDNIDARHFLTYTPSAEETKLYFLTEGTTSLREMVKGYYYDNTTAINAYWRSKAIDAGALDVTKRWTYFTLFMRNIGHTAKVAIETEVETLEAADIFEGSGNTALGFSTWGTSSWIGLVSEVGGGDTSLSTTDEAWRTQPNMEARTFTFEVSNNQAGETFYLAGFSLAYQSLKAYYFDQSNTF